MLEEISIRNYAIIDEVNIRFCEGLTVLSGDTGAGKSIVLGALSVLLGERADFSVVRNGEKKCVIEAIFGLPQQKSVRAFIEKIDPTQPPAAVLVIRRELDPLHKTSRAFINDNPVPVSALAQLSSMLVDLHQQFDTRKLNHYAFQVAVLDSLAHNETLFEQYTLSYQNYTKQQKRLDELIQTHDKNEKEQEFLRFVCAECEQLDLKPGELEQLSAALNIAQNAAHLRTLTRELLSFLREEEGSVSEQLGLFDKKLAPYAKTSPPIEALAERLAQLKIEIDDITRDVGTIEQNICVDEEQLSQMTERVNAGFDLLHKHKCKDSDELLRLYDEYAARLSALDGAEQRIAQTRAQVQQAYTQAVAQAKALSTARAEQAKKLSVAIPSILGVLGMENAKVSIRVKPKELATLDSFGMDEVAFLIDTNKSGRFEPIGKIASGGELSRIMLAIKSFVAQRLSLPTLIFDEIDSGVSGEVSKQIGRILAELSRNIQIICVTHQPMVAARAQKQFHLYKIENPDARVCTAVKELSPDERVRQIALMIGGENPTEQVLRVAHKMIHTTDDFSSVLS